MSAFDASALPREMRQPVSFETVPRLVQGVREFGLDPYVGHDLRRIAALLEKHPKKPRLSEISSPIINPLAGPHDTTVLVLQRGNDDIACAAVRIKWVESTLARAFESQAILFESHKQIPPGQRFLCTAALSQYEVRSCYVAVSNGLCVLPGERPEVIAALMRLLTLAAFSRFRWSWLIGYALHAIAEKHGFASDGFQAICSGLVRFENDKRVDYRLMLADRMYVRRLIEQPRFSDLSRPLDHEEER